MGKTTKDHPVSLPILREAARQCGFVLGRIHQDAIKHDHYTAIYTVEVVVAPVPFGGISTWQLGEMLNNCFSTDTYVLRCWKTRSEKIYAEVVTTIDSKNAERDPHVWMKDMSEREMIKILDAMALYVDDLEGVDWLSEE